MTLLAGFKVVQIGGDLAAAVCGRVLADVGAQVTCIDPGAGTVLAACLDRGKAVAATEGEQREGLAAAHLIVREGQPKAWAENPYDLAGLRRINASAIVVTISPFGETGPRADDPATDLTLFFASGIARLLTGQVDDLSEAPIRPVGEQSAFIGGLAAACAGLQAALGHQPGASIDVSIHEALATLAMTELARAGLGRTSWDRKRLSDGNGATVSILPARDGYAAISPREDKQWAAWLEGDGIAGLGRRPALRHQGRAGSPNWDELHALMSEWSRQHDKQSIADTAQRDACAELPAARRRPSISTRRSCGIAASTGRTSWRKDHPGAGPAVRACASSRRAGKRRAPEAADAAVRRARARFQLGDRGANDDALPGGDGGRGHQGRGARPRRSGARVGTAHRARPGEEEHRARPQEAGGGRDRPCAGREIRRADREFRHRGHGPARPRRRGACGRSTRT